MAGLVQPGDVINFAKLAWEVYQYGWTEELSATTQYREFFNDVRCLGKNLNILTRVVEGATSQLHGRGVYNARARWDHTSLHQIIGDYRTTLNECKELIAANKRYGVGSNPMRNIEWNVLVQPRAEQLRQRIAMHASKVHQFLTPFEIDLLSRVQQDIRNMHLDMVDRITAVHDDVRRIIGVVIPNLDQELDRKNQHSTYIIDVPADISERIRNAALNDRPEYMTDDDFQLEELSDAFILNFDRGTVNFTEGFVVDERRPPVEQYVSLLKCVWIFRKIQVITQSQAMGQESHWPSFLRQLDQNLSFQCSRFRQDLVEPIFDPSQLRGDIFSIWPETELIQLVDVVTRDEMMMQLVEMPLQGNGSTVQRKLKLLRRMGSDGRRYRIIISGIEQSTSGRPRRQTEVIDFDITSVIINPLYAMPNRSWAVQEMILSRDERIAKMAFTKQSHILKLQQALTGFKPYDGYFQYNAIVSFVVIGQTEPIHEAASIQLWVPKELEGTLVTTSDAANDAMQMSTSSRTNSFAVSDTPSLTQLSRDTFSDPFRRAGDPVSSSPPRQPNLPPIPQRQPTSPMAFPTPRSAQASPSQIGSSSPDGQGFFMSGSLQSPGRQSFSQPPPRRSSTHLSNARQGANGRSSSMSSAISMSAFSATSNSSGSDGRTTISKGSCVTGFLHRRPPKPLLVLFTQNPQTGKKSFVTIQIDEEIAMNPDRCNCRRSGKDGMACNIAAIEKRKGDAHLEAKRFETNIETNQALDWNLARLALNNPQSTSEAFNMKKLNRLSIMFPDAAARARFCGTPHQCQCRNRDQGELTKCLNDGHRGLWGKVQETYRRQSNAYYQNRYGAQKHVVNGMMTE